MNEQLARRAFEQAVQIGVEGLWPATDTRWPLQIDSQGGYEDPHINAAWIGFKKGAVPASWLPLVDSFMRSQEGEVSQGAAADMRRGIEQFAVWLTDPFAPLGHRAMPASECEPYARPGRNIPPSAWYTANWALTPWGYSELKTRSPEIAKQFKPAYAARSEADITQLQKDLAVVFSAIDDVKSEFGEQRDNTENREALARIATALQLPGPEGGAR